MAETISITGSTSVGFVLITEANFATAVTGKALQPGTFYIVGNEQRLALTDSTYRTLSDEVEIVSGDQLPVVNGTYIGKLVFVREKGIFATTTDGTSWTFFAPQVVFVTTLAESALGFVGKLVVNTATGTLHTTTDDSTWISLGVDSFTSNVVIGELPDAAEASADSIYIDTDTWTINVVDENEAWKVLNPPAAGGTALLWEVNLDAPSAGEG
jgi:hypothetical protein